MFHRGHVIEPEDVERLLDLGKQHIFVWEEQAGEIHEEDAALRLSKLAGCPGWQLYRAKRGQDGAHRTEKRSVPGQCPLLNAINSIGDITICTLPDHYPVQPGAKLASMRIVPLVTEERQIEEAERLCRESERPLLELVRYRPQKIGMIITGSEIHTGRIQDLFQPVIRRKRPPMRPKCWDAPSAMMTCRC